METNNIVLRKTSNIAVIALGMLFIASLVYYRERIFFADASYVLFHIVNSDILAIQCKRYGSIISHIFPYLGQKLHLPLKPLIIGYAISFSIFYFTVAALLAYTFKQYRLCILMSLYYFLFVSDSFFWISEIPQGVAWMFLLFGVTIYLGRKKVNILLILFLFILLAFLAISSHFVILVPTLFLFVYFIIERKIWPFSTGHTIVLSILLFLVVVSKFLFSFIGTSGIGGEAPQIQSITHASFNNLFLSFTKPVVKIFFYRSLVNYWLGV